MEQVKKQKSTKATETEVAEIPKAKDAEALKNELDALLDEIDEVLVTNAEEFVKAYKQVGGE